MKMPNKLPNLELNAIKKKDRNFKKYFKQIEKK